jgi:hypothetical protein
MLSLDFAVICQELSKVEVGGKKDHIVNLDEISITKNKFQKIFYPYEENFGLNKSFATSPENIKYISFSQNDRTIDGKKFYLLDKILQHLEIDLNVSRDCFTSETKVDLAKDLSKIKNLCDMDCCSVVSSLTWSNIKDIIEEHKKLNNIEVQPYLCLSVIFRTPTEGTNDTIVKFNYKIV